MGRGQRTGWVTHGDSVESGHQGRELGWASLWLFPPCAFPMRLGRELTTQHAPRRPVATAYKSLAVVTLESPFQMSPQGHLSALRPLCSHDSPLRSLALGIRAQGPCCPDFPVFHMLPGGRWQPWVLQRPMIPMTSLKRWASLGAGQRPGGGPQPGSGPGDCPGLRDTQLHRATASQTLSFTYPGRCMSINGNQDWREREGGCWEPRRAEEPLESRVPSGRGHQPTSALQEALWGLQTPA